MGGPLYYKRFYKTEMWKTGNVVLRTVSFCGYHHDIVSLSRDLIKNEKFGYAV